MQNQAPLERARRDVRCSMRIRSLVNVTKYISDLGQSSLGYAVNRYNVGHAGLCAIGCF